MRSASFIPGSGVAPTRKTISGSILGSTSVLRRQEIGSDGSTAITVVSYMRPQIGARTPYSSQMVRLVKPIFQPTGISPPLIRRSTMAAAIL